MSTVERDVMEYDILIVGAGPSGLACAIRLKQLKPDLNICVLEKAATIGGHTLSGAVMEPGPLDALAPEWREAKLATLLALRGRIGLAAEDTLAIGDGANDLDMIRAAGLSMAFHAKPAVAAAAAARIEHCDLTAVLFVQGYRRYQFVE